MPWPYRLRTLHLYITTVSKLTVSWVDVEYFGFLLICGSLVISRTTQVIENEKGLGRKNWEQAVLYIVRGLPTKHLTSPPKAACFAGKLVDDEVTSS